MPDFPASISAAEGVEDLYKLRLMGAFQIVRHTSSHGLFLRLRRFRRYDGTLGDLAFGGLDTSIEAAPVDAIEVFRQVFTVPRA